MTRSLLGATLLLALGTMPAAADIIVRTKDGRTFTVPVQAGEVASIEFGGAPGASSAPRPPAAPSTPPPSSGGSLLQTLLSGRSISGEAWRAGGGRWRFELKITQQDRATGSIVGEISWPSLGSVNRIRGRLSGTTLTFTETEAIKAGGAHLNVAYTFTVASTSANGTWRDAGDGTSGGAKLPVP